MSATVLVDPPWGTLSGARATYVTGDVFDCLAATPSGSVDLVLTSPPFLALRSYLPGGHPHKDREIGADADPAAFVDTLLALTAEWRRVLAPHGSIAVELGDTYSGSDGAGWPTAKSACLIPELYRIALAYGINPLTGSTSPARWRVRNTVRWCRPNPPVGALGDKFRPATSDMVIACLDTPGGQRRYFDLDAVRTGHARDYSTEDPTKTGGREFNRNGTIDSVRSTIANPAGVPPLDWWEIPTKPYGGAHYATWPTALLKRPIEAMTPRRVCTTCGEPSRRIVERTSETGRAVESKGGDREQRMGRATVQQATGEHMHFAPVRTLGWGDCGHDTWRSGVCLDPFAGSGTTLAVATGHGRAALGFDIDERNVTLAVDRIGPMFIDHHTLVVEP